MLRDEMLSGGDEVGEGIAFLFHPAGVVPRFAEFSAAADVRHRVDDTAIEQAQTAGTEIDGDGDAVTAVAVEEQGSGASARDPPPIDQRERHVGAIGGPRLQTFDDVLGGIVTAENRLLLPKDPLAGVDVVVEYGARRKERFILKANMRSIEFRILPDRRV